MNWTLIIVILIIVIIFLIPLIKNTFEIKCKDGIFTKVENSTTNTVVSAIQTSTTQTENLPNTKDLKDMVKKYCDLSPCKSIKTIPSFDSIVNNTDESFSKCLRPSLNTLAAQYWSEKASQKTTENFVQTMDCFSQLPLDSALITRFPLRVQECSGDRSSLLPDIFG